MFETNSKFGGYKAGLQSQLSSSRAQKEGMGLLEFQAMPCFSDIDSDGVLFTLTNTSTPEWTCVAVGQAGGMDRPSCTKLHPAPARSLSSSQPGVPLCWTSSLAFGLIGRA